MTTKIMNTLADVRDKPVISPYVFLQTLCYEKHKDRGNQQYYKYLMFGKGIIYNQLCRIQFCSLQHNKIHSHTQKKYFNPQLLPALMLRIHLECSGVLFLIGQYCWIVVLP